jgi:hypothetical protein
MASPVRRRNLIYVLALGVLLVVIYASYRGIVNAPVPPEKPLSDLITALEGKQVVHGTFTSADDQVDWTDKQGNTYRTFYPTGYEAVLVDQFTSSQASVDATRPPASNVLLAVILPNVILFLVIGGFMWYVLRRFPNTRPPKA